MYLSGSHSLAPDVFELGEACQDMDAAAKLAAARPLDAGASGAGREGSYPWACGLLVAVECGV